jgi:hypothetical protein
MKIRIFLILFFALCLSLPGRQWPLHYFNALITHFALGAGQHVNAFFDFKHCCLEGSNSLPLE